MTHTYRKPSGRRETATISEFITQKTCPYVILSQSPPPIVKYFYFFISRTPRPKAQKNMKKQTKIAITPKFQVSNWENKFFQLETYFFPTRHFFPPNWTFPFTHTNNPLPTNALLCKVFWATSKQHPTVFWAKIWWLNACWYKSDIIHSCAPKWNKKKGGSLKQFLAIPNGADS